MRVPHPQGWGWAGFKTQAMDLSLYRSILDQGDQLGATG